MGMLNFSGVTEAFVHSVATHAELRTLNVRLVGFAILYIALAVFFVHIPGVETVGLIWANCINMLLRIAVGYVFINKYFKVLFVCYHSQLCKDKWSGHWISFGTTSTKAACANQFYCIFFNHICF